MYPGIRLSANETCRGIMSIYSLTWMLIISNFFDNSICRKEISYLEGHFSLNRLHPALLTGSLKTERGDEQIRWKSRGVEEKNIKISHAEENWFVFANGSFHKPQVLCPAFISSLIKRILLNTYSGNASWEQTWGGRVTVLSARWTEVLALTPNGSTAPRFACATHGTSVLFLTPVLKCALRSAVLVRSIKD